MAALCGRIGRIVAKAGSGAIRQNTRFRCLCVIVAVYRFRDIISHIAYTNIQKGRVALNSLHVGIIYFKIFDLRHVN